VHRSRDVRLFFVANCLDTSADGRTLSSMKFRAISAVVTTGAAFCAIAALVLAPRLSGFQPQGPAKIAKLEVTGNKRFSAQQVSSSSGLSVGQPFDRNALNNAVNRLGDTGAFEFARYNYRSEGGNVVVELVVKEAARFHKCAFENFIWSSEKDLQDQLQKNLPLYDGSVPESGNMADAVSAGLETILKEKGIATTVTHTPFGALGDKNWVYVYSAEGIQENVVAVNFDGAATVDSVALQKEAAPLLKRNFAFTEFRLFADTSFIPFYRERGYLQVKLGGPIARPAGVADCTSGCDVTVTFPLTEGNVYTWKPAAWTGDLVVAAAELEKILGMKAGEIANERKIESGLDQLRKQYSGRGYIEVQPNTTAAFDDTAKTVTYSVKIVQGPQYHMGNLEISGFPPDLIARLQKAWRVKTGDVYDGNYLEEFLRHDVKNAINDGRIRIRKIDTGSKLNKEAATVDVSIRIS